MRFRISGSLVMLVTVLAFVALASRGDAAADRQQAVVWLSQPTLIGSTIVQGPVMFVHDEAAMRRGEACTRVYLFDPANGPTEEVTSFHCVPIERKAPRTFTMTTRPNTELRYGCVLTEYQFAGDPIAHGVPVSAMAH